METRSDISCLSKRRLYAGITPRKKMKLKPGLSAAVINAPDKYLKELKHDLEISEGLSGKYDWIQMFVKNKAELDKLFAKVLKLFKPETMLWISFPKGTSKIQTDLTRDKGWDIVAAANLKWTNLVSVNESWSAFSMRPYKPGEPKQSFR